MSRKELLKGLTPDQLNKAKACKNSDELLKLAKAEGVELSDEQLQAINGGCGGSVPDKCPFCGSDKIIYKLECESVVNWRYDCACSECGGAWIDDD